jgi:single-stranded DNA-specific DHH superfamily exonuclease
VVGLVASRLADKHYRPAIIVERGEAESRGSCRSIPEFHITEALDEVGALLERHGGHAQAAGFTVRNENLAQFQKQITELAAAEIDGRDLVPTLSIDAELQLSDVDWALQAVLEQPWAMTEPIFSFGWGTAGSSWDASPFAKGRGPAGCLTRLISSIPSASMNGRDSVTCS